MKRTPPKALLLALIGGALGTVLLAGCNTAEGVGEDLESAGESLSEAARDVNN